MHKTFMGVDGFFSRILRISVFFCDSFKTFTRESSSENKEVQIQVISDHLDDFVQSQLSACFRCMGLRLVVASRYLLGNPKSIMHT